MWSLLRHRHELAVKNGWKDSEGKVYVICTNDTLGKWLGIKSRQTIAKVKRELKAIDLLKERRRGNNEPNYLYVLFPKKVQGLNITDDLVDEGQQRFTVQPNYQSAFEKRYACIATHLKMRKDIMAL